MLVARMHMGAVARWIAVAAGIAFTGLAPVAKQSATGGHVCGFFHAHVPYSALSGGPRWRAYVRGATSCSAATNTLDAVMHHRGTDHFNGSESNSYITYRNWTCPYGQMGVQLCFLGSTRHPRARALAHRCSETPCPSNRVPTF